MSLFSEFLHQVAPKDGWGTAFVTAGLGAFVGGLVASRAFNKRAVVAELNALRSAQTLCFAVSNKFISLKSQHVREMKMRFDLVLEEHQRFLNQPRQKRGLFELRADYQTLSPIMAPIDELKKIVFEKTSIRGKALVALVELASSSADLRKSIEDRKVLADEMRSDKKRPHQEIVELYLGLRTAEGHIDERFRGNIQALHLQTDDCIFFARTLATEIVDYGNRLRRRYMWRYWLGMPKFQNANWAASKDLLPDEALYERWSRGFQKSTRWRRFRALISP